MIQELEENSIERVEQRTRINKLMELREMVDELVEESAG